MNLAEVFNELPPEVWRAFEEKLEETPVHRDATPEEVLYLAKTAVEKVKANLSTMANIDEDLHRVLDAAPQAVVDHLFA